MNAKRFTLLFALVVVVSALGCSVCSAALADDWPTSPIRFISTAGPGGAAETFMRRVAPFVEKYLGVHLRIENIEGGAGAIGTNVIKNAPHDGYTWGTRGPLSTLGNIYTGGADFTLDDFDYIVRVNNDPTVFMVRKDAEWNTLAEFVDYVKTQAPDTVRIAFGNVNDIAAVGWTLIEEAAGIELNKIGYNNGNEARLAVLRGEVVATHANWFGSAAIWNDVKVLAVHADERNKVVPALADIPTVNEQLGIDVPEVTTSYIINTSAGFEDQYPERFQKVADAWEKALSDPELLQIMKDAEMDGYLEYKNPEETKKEVEVLVDFYMKNMIKK